MSTVDYNEENKKIFFFGTVNEVNDPLMVNRIRVLFDDVNNKSVLDSIPDTKNGKRTKNEDGSDLLPEFKWTEIDNFCFLPLLPVFLKTTPKVGETVNLFFPNLGYRYTEQYYIQGVFSSPNTFYYENNNQQRGFAVKDRIKRPANLKNPVNNEYNVTKTKGVFVEPEDVGIVGRGTCDIIVKENEILLRTGKSTTLPKYRNKNVLVNNKRAFFQMSNYINREDPAEDIETIRLQKKVLYTKTLMEYTILNPENMFNSFSYTINLYNLPEKPQYTTEKIYIDSNVDNNDKALIFSATFNNESMESMTNKILLFLKQFGEGVINLSPYPITEIKNQYPLYFRPSPDTFGISNNPSNGEAYINVSVALNRLDYKTLKNGFGLVWSKTATGEQFIPRKNIKKNVIIKTGTTVTYNILGADKMLFLSHESRIPSKKLISMDDTTVYGIEQSYLVNNILPNTNGMVRGEELMKFLNLIVKFLASHTHAFPGLPPTPISWDKTNIADIIQQLANANETIINKNIRIN